LYQASLKLKILLPQLSKCWDYRPVPPLPTAPFLFKKKKKVAMCPMYYKKFIYFVQIIPRLKIHSLKTTHKKILSVEVFIVGFTY
jgi:hypothetical protein